jgi:tRNA A-37 threonylcarbamoyl transferase component Bud32/tetratricopeptide (TPR) repeat protein
MQTLRGSQLDGRYELLEPAGRGGMATVWKARDHRLGRDVAVKLISEARLDEPGFVERFELEAQIAARLSHPNLVGVHDLSIDAGQPYIVMEFIEGETLEQRLERAPESVDAVALARTLLDALATIHDEGIVHRDLKPGNVMYQDDGRIRLTDFGIARILGSTTITEAGHVIGTLEYMAPEVRSGETPTPAADLYSLGVLLAKCGADEGPLADLVGRLRSADPARRPQSARLAAVSIAGVAAESPQPEWDEEDTGVVETEPVQQTETLPQRDPAAVLGVAPPAHRDPTPPSAPAAPATHAKRGVPTPALLGATIAAILAVGVVFALTTGGGDGDAPSGSSQTAQTSEGKDSGSGNEPAADEETAPAEPAPEEAAAEPVATGGGGDPVALNDEGFAMLEAGDAEGAVPVLEEAVAAWPEGTDDIGYAYTIFNLAVAYRQTGRPEEAIPLLKERLQWDDQTETVQAELELAKSEAG